MLQYERKFCRKSQNVYRRKAQEFKHVRYSVLAPYLPMSFLKNTLLRSSDSGCSRTFPTKLFCVASTCGNSGKIFLELNLRMLSISLLVFSTFTEWPQLFWCFFILIFLDSWSLFAFLCALSTSISEVQHLELDTML